MTKNNDLKKPQRKPLFRFSKPLFAAPFGVFMLLFVVLPLLLIFVNAFFENGKITVSAFGRFFTDGYSLNFLLRSLWVAVVATLICLLVAYPLAYILSRSGFRQAPVIILLLIMPMWINSLLRVVAIRDLLSLFTGDFGFGTIIFGLVCDFLPFMILPIYTVLANMDKSLMEASQDLGAAPAVVFLKTTLPLSVSGIISGCMMVFMPAVSTLFVSKHLGAGKSTSMFGELIEQVVLKNHDMSIGSVMAIIMLVLIGLSVVLTNRFSKIGNSRGGLW